MNMAQQTALWIGIQDLKCEIAALRKALEEIARGFDSHGLDYTREGMMRMAKEALKRRNK